MDGSIQSGNTALSGSDQANRDRSKENIERIKNKQKEEGKRSTASESVFRSYNSPSSATKLSSKDKNSIISSGPTGRAQDDPPPEDAAADQDPDEDKDSGPHQNWNIESALSPPPKIRRYSQTR